MTANVISPTWEFEGGDPHVKVARVGAQADSELIGAAVYQLDAGASTGPLHVHRANEELLVVLAGSPVIRRVSGEREQLETGSVVSFHAGPAGGHAIENEGPGPARVLIVSTMRFPDVVEHPDRGTVLIMHGPPEEGTEFLLFNRSDGTDQLPD